MMNKILKTFAVFAGVLLISSVMADPPAGKGLGNSNSSKVVIAPGSTPPGLSKKVSKPYGLMKQGKTPKGWTKGVKKGWNCTANGNYHKVCFDGKIKRHCQMVHGVWFCNP